MSGRALHSSAGPRVGVRKILFERNRPTRGAGRVYHNVLPELGRMTQVRVYQQEPRWRKPDVWLESAHGGAFRSHPVVAVCHGAGWLSDPAVARMVSADYFERFSRNTEAAVRSAAMIIAPSNHTRDALIAGYDLDPSTVVTVYHGVDADFFSPARTGGREIVAERVGGDRPYILFASGITRGKNPLALREATRHLTDHVLVFAGEIPESEDPEYVEAALEDAVWLGHVSAEDVAKLMAGADVCCLPSETEAFPLTVLEAMACRTAVVVSDRGGLPEVVGDAGIVCPVSELRGAIDQALARQDELAQRARERALGLSWRRTSEGWLEVLQTAAHQVKRSRAAVGLRAAPQTRR
jgi:glycosyltransferase involved in cell wall biosynthesis